MLVDPWKRTGIKKEVVHLYFYGAPLQMPKPIVQIL